MSGIQHARLQRGIPGIEPGTSRTLSENHAARPNPQAMKGVKKTRYLPQHAPRNEHEAAVLGSETTRAAAMLNEQRTHVMDECSETVPVVIISLRGRLVVMQLLRHMDEMCNML